MRVTRSRTNTIQIKRLMMYRPIAPQLSSDLPVGPGGAAAPAAPPLPLLPCLQAARADVVVHRDVAERDGAGELVEHVVRHRAADDRDRVAPTVRDPRDHVLH